MNRANLCIFSKRGNDDSIDDDVCSKEICRLMQFAKTERIEYIPLSFFYHCTSLFPSQRLNVRIKKQIANKIAEC